MTPKPYYHLESTGVETNLQLYSLQLAWHLLKDLNPERDNLTESRIKERCVVIVDLLGLSLSQLFGQNYHGGKEKIPSLKDLFSDFIKKADDNVSVPPALKDSFNEFLEFYDDCRHFGISKHSKIDLLDLDLTNKFMELTIGIWDRVCLHFRDQDTSSIEFNSVRDILEDDDLETTGAEHQG